jgi:hypothetical protein
MTRSLLSLPRASQARRNGSPLAVAALAAACLLLLAGCSGKRPLFEHGSEGTRIMEKRIPRYPEKDYLRRYRGVAYNQNFDGGAKASGADQKRILAEQGQPDYIRRPFESTRGDIAHEWNYLEKNKTFQFVENVCVFEGPLSDKDRVVIQWGYPSRVLVQNDHLGSRRETYIYEDAFDSNTRYFSFANDKMVLGIESY